MEGPGGETPTHESVWSTRSLGSGRIKTSQQQDFARAGKISKMEYFELLLETSIVDGAGHGARIVTSRR